MPQEVDRHPLNCPECGADFVAEGARPLVTECPACGAKGYLR